MRRTLVKRRWFPLAIFALVAGVDAREITVDGGKSPGGRYEIVLLTEPPYASDIDGAPGVALRAAGTKAVISSFIWPGDVGDPTAREQTKAYWSADSRYVALEIRAGRLSPRATIYSASGSGLQPLPFAPLPERVQARYFSGERPVNGGTAFERWADARTIELRDTVSDRRFTYRITRGDKLELTKVSRLGRPNQAMQLTASKPVVCASGVCRRERMLRGMHRGLAAADL